MWLRLKCSKPSQSRQSANNVHTLSRYIIFLYTILRDSGQLRVYSVLSARLNAYLAPFIHTVLKN